MLMRNVYLLFCLLFLSLSLNAQTPYQVKVINPGGADARPERMTPYDGKLIFRARTAGEGLEPWISDGTEEGTFLLLDINDDPGLSAGDSDPDYFTLYNGLVYFKARDANNGNELWVTDGTAEGTFLLKDIHPGGNGNPVDIAVFNNLLFFTADDGANGAELWVSDGAEEGTSLFLDINPGGSGNPSSKTVIGDYMYFAAGNGADGTEIWRSNGTVEGTALIKNMNPGAANSLPSRFFAYNGEVYFSADNGVNGVELWKTDGTEAGTVLVKDIRPGAGNANPGDFFIVDSLLYFTADDGENGVELWVTDGTEAGTLPAYDFNPAGDGNPANFTQVIPGTYLCTANDGESGNELWLLTFFQGTVEAELFLDLNPGPDGSNPAFFIDNGFVYYFSATTATDGKELYYLTLLQDFPELLADINPGAGDGKVEELTRVGERIFFRADNGTDGLQLWAMDAPLSQLVVKDEEEEVIAPGAVLDFGEVMTGETATREIILENTGGAELLVYDNGALELEVFYTGWNFFFPIPPGEAQTMLIEFSPLEAGEFEEVLAIISFSASDKTYPIRLRGKAVSGVAVAGIFESDVAIPSGAALDFGSIEIGAQSTRTITIRNNGTAPLLIDDVQIAGTEFNVNGLPQSVLPNDSKEVEIRFAPSTAGPHTGSLSFSTNDPGLASFTLNFTGEGVALIPGISLVLDQNTVPSGSVIDFGTVLLGEDSVRTFSLQNPGNGVLKLLDIEITGTDFSISGLPVEIAAFGEDAFEVRFTPSAAGPQTGSLSFSTNVPGVASFSLNFTGVGDMGVGVVELSTFGAEVFPNPAGEEVFIRMNQPLHSGHATLLNAEGQLIKQLSLAQSNMVRINLAGLPAGVYLLRLGDSERTAWGRVVKR